MPAFLTLLLKGSLPDSSAKGRPFSEIDRLLDAPRSGPLHLQRPEVASMVVSALRHHANCLKYFDLHAYVVMPNHVHMLVTPHVSVSKLTQSVKRHIAREANRILHRTGAFWEDDWIGCVSDDAAEIERYIEGDPVTAGMVSTPGEFPWTSAPVD